MEREAKKCQLLCLKCHRVVTEGRRDNSVPYAARVPRLADKWRYMIQKKRDAGSCNQCKVVFDESASTYFEFDHLPGTDKVDNVSNMVRSYCSLADLKAEIAKCQLLCGNCHRIVTYDRRRADILQKRASVAKKAKVDA